MAGYEWDMPFTRPDWFPQGTYNWTQSESPVVPNMMQTWWRSPSWGSGAVWHPHYGYQPWKDIKQQYKSAPGPVTWDQFTGWGYTPQMDPDWSQYGFTHDTGGGGGGPDANYNYGGGNPMTYNYPTMGNVNPQWLQQQVPQSQGFQYPQQWQTATDVLNPMAYAGLPTSQHPWYQQAKGVAETDIRNAIAQANEQMGMKGLRWSTPAMERGQRIAGETMGQVGLEWTGREMDAQEQARQRQLQATGQLGALGQQAFQAPMDWVQQAYGMGAAQTQQRQQQLQPLLQEIMRTLPEGSPWLQMIQAFVGTPFQSAMPNQYQPGFGSTALSGLSSFLPFLFLL